MAITSDGWFDWAVRDPGPPNRATVYGSGPSTMELMVSHSYEGLYYPTGYSPLRDPNRFPTAWCATNMLSGEFRQHYPVTAKLAHAGDWANRRGPGFEAEGWASLHPMLNAAQVRNYLRVIDDMRALTGRPFLRVPGSLTGIIEHREVMQTACPSGRYAPVWAALEDDMGMTPEEQKAFQDLHLQVVLLSKMVVEHGLKATYRDWFKTSITKEYDKAFLLRIFGPEPRDGDTVELKDKDAFDYAVIAGLTLFKAVQGVSATVNVLARSTADVNHQHGDLYAPKVHPHPEFVPRGEALSGLITID